MAKVTMLEVGTRSGKLVVLEVFRGSEAWQVKVRCDCGNEKVMFKSNFTKGNARSCGCVPPGKPFERKHGLSTTTSYNSWKKMMSRCYDPLNTDYVNYGGRGITVCERWHDVTAFVEDMGIRGKTLSIERIDVNGIYEKSNCAWIPLGAQSKNRTDWKHTDEGKRIISDSRKQDWQNGVYADKVAAQQVKE
jgi:hypothetical protein